MERRKFKRFISKYENDAVLINSTIINFECRNEEICERFDGGGYPLGLHGDEIPPVAQLIAVADTFDAMYSNRPYRNQLPLSVALQELESIAGTQLNETYVKAFIRLAEEGELIRPEEAASLSVEYMSVISLLEILSLYMRMPKFLLACSLRSAVNCSPAFSWRERSSAMILPITLDSLSTSSSSVTPSVTWFEIW